MCWVFFLKQPFSYFKEYVGLVLGWPFLVWYFGFFVWLVLVGGFLFVFWLVVLVSVVGLGLFFFIIGHFL